jgi:hypothetical protein
MARCSNNTTKLLYTSTSAAELLCASIYRPKYSVCERCIGWPFRRTRGGSKIACQIGNVKEAKGII